MINLELARALWRRLHISAIRLKSNHGQEKFLTEWLLDVERALGCTSCFWKVKRFCDLCPVTFGKSFWLWSICLHDYVNKELGRALFYPQLTLAPLTAKGLIQ